VWQFNLADDSVIAGDGARRSVHEQLIVLLTSCRRLVVGVRRRLGVATDTVLEVERRGEIRFSVKPW